MLRTSHQRASLSLLIPAALAISIAATTRAQQVMPPDDPAEAWDQVNRLIEGVPASERAEDVLFPALAAMDPAPEGVGAFFEAGLLSPLDDSWNDAARWAERGPQVAALDALRQVGDRSADYAFTLPYGDAAPGEWISAGLGAVSRQGGLIAGIHFGYLDAFERLGALVQVEATRLATRGEPQQACDLLLNWLRFCRIVADRHFIEEVAWALADFRLGVERIRDVVFTHEPEFEADGLRDTIRSLDDREFRFDRLRLPRADKWAGLQLIRVVLEERGGPKAGVFAPTIAQLAASGRPLDLFAQAGRWEQIAERHAGWFDTIDSLNGLYSDFELRWGLNELDPVLRDFSEYDRLDPARFAMVRILVDDVRLLIRERLRVRTEMGGTQIALGLVGFKLLQRDYPPSMFGIRGGSSGFLDRLPPDPYDPETVATLQRGQEPRRFTYFVPVRDRRRNPREEPPPHRMTVNAPARLVGHAGVGDIDVAPFEGLVRQWVDRGIDASNISERVDEFFATFDTVEGVEPPSLPEIPEQLASQPDRVRTALARAIMESEATQQALGLVSRGRAITVQVLLDSRRQVSESMPDILREVFADDPSVTALIDSAGGVGGGWATQAVDVDGPADIAEFLIELDETTFVLYSVGDDGRAQGALDVGVGGDDYLIWPPVMSIIRSHIHGLTLTDRE